MAISGQQTRLRLWCLGGEKKCQEQKPLKVALVCQSAFLIHSLFSFLWEVREEVEEVKVGRRFECRVSKKKAVSLLWAAGAEPGEGAGGQPVPLR